MLYSLPLVVAGLIVREAASRTSGRSRRSDSGGEDDVLQISLRLVMVDCTELQNNRSVELHYRTWTLKSSTEQEGDWSLLETLTTRQELYNLSCSRVMQGIQFLLLRVHSNMCRWRVRDFTIKGCNIDTEIDNFRRDACYVCPRPQQDGERSGIVIRAFNYHSVCPGNFNSLLTE